MQEMLRVQVRRLFIFGFFTILMMLGVAYAYLREGLLTAFAMLINVLIAGTVAFNLFEPLASMMEPTLSNTFFAGYEDMVCLIGLFAITLGILHTIVNTISASMVRCPAPMQRPGGTCRPRGRFSAPGSWCALYRRFPGTATSMSFDWEVKSTPEPIRRVLPPDRVWLA